MALTPDTVSRLNTRYDWPAPLTFEERAVETRRASRLAHAGAGLSLTNPDTLAAFDDRASDRLPALRRYFR